MAATANCPRRHHDLSVGDKAWLDTWSLQLPIKVMRKFASHYVGLYDIVQSIGLILF